MPSISHALHVPWFQFDGGRDLKLLYVLRATKVFVDKFALFFLPVFLFQLGAGWSVGGDLVRPTWLPPITLTLSELQLGMLVIVVFFGLYRFWTLVTVPALAWVLHRFGNRLTMLLGYGFFGVGILALHGTYRNAILLFVASAAFGAFMAFTNVTEYLILAKNSHKANLGKDIGLGQFLIQMSNMVAPLLGGLVIVSAGYQSLFLIGCMMLLGLMSITLLLRGQKVRVLPNWSEGWSLLRNRSFQVMMMSSLGRYSYDMVIALWPVYLFLLLGSADKVGYLYSLSFFMAMLVSMAGGAQIDRAKTRRPFLGSGTALAGLWISRAFFLNPYSIAIIDALDRLVGNYHWMYFDTALLKEAKVRRPETFLIVREMVLSFFAILLWIGVGVIFMLLVESWRGVFVLAAVGVLFSILIRETIEYPQA